jgi:hypothetical protein
MTNNEKRKLELQRDVERALENYMGVGSFSEPEYPQLAEAFAKAVSSAYISEGFPSPREAGFNAQEFARSIAGLTEALAAVAE